MSPNEMINEYSPLNDSPLCAECNLSITDGSYILWKGVERVCHKCRNDRVERLRKVRRKKIEAAEKKRALNVSALKMATSATTVQLKAREKWGLQRIYLEATFSDIARTQRIRYFFANDIPTYIPSRSRRHTLYLKNVTEIGTPHRECHDCGHELELDEGIQWNYTIRLCQKCYSERKRTMKFGKIICIKVKEEKQ